MATTWLGKKIDVERPITDRLSRAAELGLIRGFVLPARSWETLKVRRQAGGAR